MPTVHPDTSAPSEPLTVPPAEGARRLGVSRATFYELLRAGELRSFKVGARRLVPVAEIDRYIVSHCPDVTEGL